MPRISDLQEITNYAGTTYRVGARVRNSDGWTGTITGIVEQRDVDLLLVQPDEGAVLCGYDKVRPLNAAEAERTGRPDTCRPRDEGRSMGNYTLL